MAVDITTIGFTKKSAEAFFTTLRTAGVQRVVDVRLNNLSQLSGFSKRDDLQFFLQAICGIDYVHLPELAPTPEMLHAFRTQKGDRSLYEKRFLDLMAARRIECAIPSDILDGGCLLRGEDKPHRCHRRLVAEYLSNCWGDVHTRHLG